MKQKERRERKGWIIKSGKLVGETGGGVGRNNMNRKKSGRLHTEMMKMMMVMIKSRRRRMEEMRGEEEEDGVISREVEISKGRRKRKG